MPSWERIYGDLTAVESSINDDIQKYNNLIRDVDSDATNDAQLAAMKETEQRIESSLRKYMVVLMEMESFVHKEGSDGKKSIRMRFREVYRELSASFNRSREAASIKSTRAQLFSNIRTDTQDDDSETQLLLKEMTATKNSLRMADNYLESALQSHEILRSQRGRLQRSGGVLEGLTQRFPAIQQLTRNVHFRRNRDNIIVAVVIALCICFCLWYASR
ncbi:hypothetical protein WA556_003207 [Blastocystis sp. ATCC 50177/Nand II]